MGLLPFLGGAAQGAGRELSDQNDRAFQLKIQNAQLEGALKNQEALFDYQKASPQTTASIFGTAGIEPQPGQRESVQELGLLAGLEKSRLSAEARKAQQRASSRGMSVGQFRQIFDVDIPGKDTDWLSPAAIDAYKFRLRSESAPASVKTNYVAISNGVGLLEKLKALREEAVNESPVGGGPLAGRALSLVAKGEKGKLFPKTAAYLALKQANLAGIAELMGEKGRKAEGDIERADKAVPGLEYDPKAANEIFNSVLSIGKFNKENMEYQFSDLARKKERMPEAELGAASGKETKLTENAKKFSGMTVDERLDLLIKRREAKRKAAEQAAKKAR